LPVGWRPYRCIGPLSSSLRLVSRISVPALCVAGDTTTMWEPVRWLSHVCEVITDPSVDALRPTMIDVQAATGSTTVAMTITKQSNHEKTRRRRMGFS
jgi:hypothetical protein